MENIFPLWCIAPMTTATSSAFRKTAHLTMAAIAALAVSLSPSLSQAYSSGTRSKPGTHPYLTARAAELYQENYPGELDLEALKQGSIDEDGEIGPDGKRYYNIRSYNHFQDGKTRKGLWNFPSASKWAESPELQSGLVPLDNFVNAGLWWTAPLAAFYGAILILRDNGTYPFGDQSWQQAVDNQNHTALGHILHLDEDMTVPAHVRGDPHAILPTIVRQFEDYELHEDAFEIWAKKYDGIAQLTPSSSVRSYSSLRDVFNETASFTADNFFSDNTIDPTVIEELEERREGLKTYYYKNINGRDVPVARKGFLQPFVLDWKVLEEQWKILGAKAVESSAAVIKLYFESQSVDAGRRRRDAGYQERPRDGGRNDGGRLRRDGGSSCVPDYQHCHGQDVMEIDTCGSATLVRACRYPLYCRNAECVDDRVRDGGTGVECTPADGCNENGCIFYDSFSGSQLASCRWNSHAGGGSSITVSNGILDFSEAYGGTQSTLNSVRTITCPGNWTMEYKWKTTSAMNAFLTIGSFGPHMRVFGTHFYCNNDENPIISDLNSQDWNTTRMEQRGSSFTVYNNGRNLGTSNNTGCSLDAIMFIQCRSTSSSGDCLFDYIKIKCN